MISMEQITGEIAALEEEKPTHVTMQKLASLYVVRDHMTIQPQAMEPLAYYSIPDIGTDTDFAGAVKGKDAIEVLKLMDEIVSTLYAINPQMYSSILRRLGK